MKGTWIARDISFSNLVQGLVALGLVAVAVTLGYVTHNYVYNALAGPFLVEEANLGEIESLNAEGKYFITLRTTRVYKTGLIGTLNGAPSTEYVVATNGKHALLIRCHIDHDSKEYTGTLETSAEFLSDARMAVSSRQPELYKMLYPVVLESVVPIRWKGYALIVVCVGLAGTGCWLGMRAVLRTLNPLTHPYAVALKRHGDPEKIAAELQDESAHVVTVGSAHLGKHWLWSMVGGALHVYRLDEIVWVYRTIVVDRAGKPVRHAYRVLDCHAVPMDVTAKQADVDAFLAEVNRRLPWVFNGINADIEQLWHLDRAAFLDAVAQRRAKMQANPDAPR